jgi:hypothetical protein
MRVLKHFCLKRRINIAARTYGTESLSKRDLIIHLRVGVAMKIQSLCMFAATLLFCATAASQPGSQKINITPGKWADEMEFTGPAGDTMQIRKGRAYVNGKDMLAGQLTAQQLRELEADSVRCISKEEVPTVAQAIDDFLSQMSDDDDAGNSVSNMRLLEATPTKARFEGEFSTQLKTKKPFSGATTCTANFAGERSAMECDITWKTPPHAGKKTKMHFRSARVGNC